MAREPMHKRLYKESPRMERDGETGNMKVGKSPNENERKASEVNAGTDGMPVTERHSHERREMAHRHHGEHMAMHHKHEMEHSMHHGDKKELHDRHEAEHAEKHTRHHAEMKKLHDRHEKEGGAEKTGGTERGKESKGAKSGESEIKEREKEKE